MIYLITSHTSDGVEVWESVVGILMNLDHAKAAAEKLSDATVRAPQNASSYQGTVDFEVQEWTVPGVHAKRFWLWDHWTRAWAEPEDVEP